MMELGKTAADKLSSAGPTLFILDANHWTIDADWLSRYARSLAASACKFQTIVTTRPRLDRFRQSPLDGLEGFPTRRLPSKRGCNHEDR